MLATVFLFLAACEVKWSELSSSPFIMETTLAVGLALSVEWFICSGLPNGLQVPLSPSPVPNSIVVWDPFQNDSNGMGGNTDPTISCLLEKKLVSVLIFTWVCSCLFFFVYLCVEHIIYLLVWCPKDFSPEINGIKTVEQKEELGQR